MQALFPSKIRRSKNNFSKPQKGRKAFYEKTSDAVVSCSRNYLDYCVLARQAQTALPPFDVVEATIDEAADLPDLIGRHKERMAALDQLRDLLMQLKATREAKGLSLSDLTELTGMDRLALSKLETGLRANPTDATLVRYAEAVGKRLVVSLVDANDN
jgi:hypothetical protein